jgi:hypothetical protein
VTERRHRVLILALLLVPALFSRELLWSAASVAALDCVTESKAATNAALQKKLAAKHERTVFLTGKLSDENLLSFTSALAASSQPGVFLLDTSKATASTKLFLTAFQPEQIVPVGEFPKGLPELEGRLETKLTPALPWHDDGPLESWKNFFPQVDRVVLCPAKPRGLLLQAACLAGVVRAPLVVVQAEEKKGAELRRQLSDWHLSEILAVGRTADLCRDLQKVHVVPLEGEEALVALYLQHQRESGPIRTLVVTNPADCQGRMGNLSVLAPWVALQRKAALLCTNNSGDNMGAVVLAALKRPALARVDSLILVAGLKAIPMERRPNPVAGKDTWIEMEPLTPSGSEPFTFATGRLFQDDLGVFTLALARQSLLAEETRSPRPRNALVVSNPGGGLALLETFSRNTANELRNAGYQTTARFDDEVSKKEVRQLLPSQDIFLWEGHYRTMVDQFELPKWTEPLQPGLVFLQSCLALNEAEARPLFERGAVAVVGSSTRTYSASGGAFTLAFFDALLYEHQSLGGGLRQAKNFLLTYSLLKAKLLGDKAKLSGANMRSAWAFTLWGDPTLKLPHPEMPPEALSPVTHRVHGNTITLTLPETSYPKIGVGQYRAEMRPNTRMAGLLTKGGDEDDRHLVPFLFAEVYLPKAPARGIPRLSSRLPSRHWVFNWDARRRCGYLLVAPRQRDEKEARFHVSWEE